MECECGWTSHKKRPLSEYSNLAGMKGNLWSKGTTPHEWVLIRVRSLRATGVYDNRWGRRGRLVRLVRKGRGIWSGIWLCRQLRGVRHHDQCRRPTGQHWDVKVFRYLCFSKWQEFKSQTLNNGFWKSDSFDVPPLTGAVKIESGFGIKGKTLTPNSIKVPNGVSVYLLELRRWKAF